MLGLDQEVFLIYARGDVNGTLEIFLISDSISVRPTWCILTAVYHNCIFLFIIFRWYTYPAHSQVTQHK